MMFAAVACSSNPTYQGCAEILAGPPDWLWVLFYASMVLSAVMIGLVLKKVIPWARCQMVSTKKAR